MAAQAGPLAHAHLNGVSRPATRSTSRLSKQVLPEPEEDDDDEAMEDEVVLAQLPSRSQDADLSSQTRLMLHRPGSSAFDERVSVAQQSDFAVDDDEQVHLELAHRLEMDGVDMAERRWAEEEPLYSEEDLQDEEEDVEEEDDDDEMDDSRSEGERYAIGLEMDGLEKAVPGLSSKYHLVDRLGEGTFSSVYKAVDIQHHTFDNSSWQSMQKKGKVYVAIKRIYVTSSPIRIQNELEILKDLRGSRNVAYLIDAIRYEDQVLAVMPFNRHQDFRSYYRTATLPLLRSYFSCLFRALMATHDQHIIHRDVKPANFLYDFTTGDGILCDYGLAQKIGGDEWFEWKSDCLHSLPGPSWGGAEGRKRALARMEKSPAGPPGLCAGLHGVKLAKPLSLYEQTVAMTKEWEQEYVDSQEMGLAEAKENVLKRPWEMPPGWKSDIKGRMVDRQAFLKSWRPAMEVVKQKNKQRPGVLKDDRRPSVRANRAGTRGFRAPEVLFKCPDQTASLDIWSVGIILLCFLTRRFPFFNSNDDVEALAEITSIFGKKKMEVCANLHNRTFQTNIPDYDKGVHANFHELVRELNPPIIVENSPDPYGPIPASRDSINKWYEGSDLCKVVDLMKRCLELDCTRRWTAEECLSHPFFAGKYDLGLGRSVYRSNGFEQ
ncbi:hypothetical protein JCM8547_009142 [Rhodosporidiobolus lusitaniae]